MAKKVGIYINLSAGTQQFILDMEKANASVKNFSALAAGMGTHGVTGVQAVSGALRVLEGGITNNLRAAERFTANVLGLGPVLQAAFPVIGALAFGGVVVKVGEEITNFSTRLREAPLASAMAFRTLNEPPKSLNDSLELTNAKLENSIAKLEGRRQNNLKIALLEARDAADKLSDSLAKDLAGLQKVLKENEIGNAYAFFTGTGATTDIREQFEKLLQEEAAVKRSGQARVDAAVAANDKAAVQAAQQELNNRLLNLYNQALDETNKKLAETQRLSIQSPQMRGGGRPTPEGQDVVKATTDMRVRIQQLTDARDLLEQSIRRVPLETRQAELKGKQSGLEEQNPAKPFEDRINKLKADLSSLTLQMNSIGQDAAGQVLAKATGEAIKAIEEINKAYEGQHRVLSGAEEQKLRDLNLQIAATQNEEQWRSKLQVSTNEIREQVRGQELLTAAIGKGYEATKKAAVEVELMSKLGFAAYVDPMNRSAVDIERQNLTVAYEGKHTMAIVDSSNALDEQIRLENRLAQVQSQGAQAVRLVTMQATIEKLRLSGATQAQIDKEIELFNAQQRNAAAADLAKVNERIDGIKRLAAAQVQGAEAVRKATLENTIDEIKRTVPKDSQQAAIDAARRQSQAEQELKISEVVAGRVNLYSNHLAELEEERAYLQTIQVTEENRLDIIRATRDVENERLRVLRDQALATGTARDGIRAFFLEMQADGKKASQTVFDAFNSTFEGVSANFAKLATGQRTDWKKMFQGIGDDIIKDQTKAQLRKVVTDIGGHFPGLSGITGKLGISGKPDGTSADKALWVRMAGIGGSAIPLPGGGTAPSGGVPGGIGSLSSLIIKNLIPHAGGGDVTAGSAYMVGERGPEPFFPGVSGTMLSNGAARSLGGNFHQYIIDARGADAGVVQRVEAALDAYHRSAVANSVRAMNDRTRRVPSMAGAQ
jgi:hypothetical protein